MVFVLWLFFFIKWNSHQNELEIEIFWHHRYWEHPPWLIRAVSLHPPCRRLNVSFGVKFMPVKKPRGGGRKWRSFMFLTNYFASRNFRAWTCFSWTSVLKYLTWAKLTVKLFTGWTYFWKFFWSLLTFVAFNTTPYFVWKWENFENDDPKTRYGA